MVPQGFGAKLRLGWGALRHLGPRWLLFRLGYALRKRSGVYQRRSPVQSWDQIPLVPCRPLWPVASSHSAHTALPDSATAWPTEAIADAERIAAGDFLLFFHHRLPLGCPPEWLTHPFSGLAIPADTHWSAQSEYGFGDIKAIWELSRFGWAFTLARAYARTGDLQHAEVFWRLFEDWCQHNPPNAGMNWNCGQESTFRLMATTFAMAQFERASATTPARRELWSRLVISTGRRIAANLDYALSQSNNHGVSESVGLLTAGLLAQDSAESAAWRERGLRCLRSQLDVLLYADGGFSQHSLMYHRLVVQDLLWAIVMLRAAGKVTPDWLQHKARQALKFLAVLVDPETGAAPFWGSNDGSNILPLDDCPYDDVRGTVQAGYAVLDGTRALPAGPWDESAFWLTGKDPAALPVHAPERVERWHASESGCFQWRSGDARLYMFCPTRFRHRVVEADMLHVDLWWRGMPVLHDAGSYSYNAPGRFTGAFSKAAAHNVPMLQGVEPLRKASRFLQLPWPRGTAAWSPDGRCFSATHDAYGSLAQLKRTITNPAVGEFVVTDSVTLGEPACLRLHWLLADNDWQLDLAAGTVSAPLAGGRFLISWESSVKPRAVTLVRADKESTRGWWSRHYLAVDPAVSLELLFDFSGSCEIATHFAFRDR